MLTIAKATIRILRPQFLVFLFVLGFAGSNVAADSNPNSKSTGSAGVAPETNSDAEGKAAEAIVVGTNESLRSYLQIQEQLHETQLAIEKNRQEAEAAAARDSAALDDRLSAMEKTFTAGRVEALKGVEHSDRLVLIAAGIFSGVGFVVLLLAAYLQWSAVNRLAAAATGLSSPYSPEALPSSENENQLAISAALEESSTRFLGAIDRLERRIQELETSVKAPKPLPEPAIAHAAVKSIALAEPEPVPEPPLPPPPAPNRTEDLPALLTKCQTLLRLEKHEEALDCLDEILAIDPGNADALVKKGAALERLQRFDEAIEYYDRAIAQDNSMTMAYLYKGGVFNRMERYSEALECYEQALKTRQKGQAANVIID